MYQATCAFLFLPLFGRGSCGMMFHLAFLLKGLIWGLMLYVFENMFLKKSDFRSIGGHNIVEHEDVVLLGPAARDIPDMFGVAVQVADMS